MEEFENVRLEETLGSPLIMFTTEEIETENLSQVVNIAAQAFQNETQESLILEQLDEEQVKNDTSDLIEEKFLAENQPVVLNVTKLADE